MLLKQDKMQVLSLWCWKVIELPHQQMIAKMISCDLSKRRRGRNGSWLSPLEGDIAEMAWILELSLLLRTRDNGETHERDAIVNASQAPCRQFLSSALILDNPFLVDHHVHLLQMHLLNCPKVSAALSLNRRTCYMAVVRQYFEDEWGNLTHQHGD